MGIGRSVSAAAIVAAVAILSSSPAFAGSAGRPAEALAFRDAAAASLKPLSLAGFVSTAQDVITEEDYERLTGVRKRIGAGLWGGIGIMGGPDAGAFRVNYADTFTTKVSFDDLFAVDGYTGGVEGCMIVSPFYSVHFGAGVLYHQGKTFRGNTFSDLTRYPFYIGLRVNAPMSLSFDKWLDFENPEFAFGLIPFAMLRIQATWWSPVYISGNALPSYEPERVFFVQGLYPEAGLSGGIEFRFGGGLEGLALKAEAGLTYQVMPPMLSKYFSKDPTVAQDIIPGSPFEAFLEFGITFHFGSGRLFKVISDYE